jgi:hypothetical protein
MWAQSVAIVCKTLQSVLLQYWHNKSKFKLYESVT